MNKSPSFYQKTLCLNCKWFTPKKGCFHQLQKGMLSRKPYTPPNAWIYHYSHCQFFEAPSRARV